MFASMFKSLLNKSVVDAKKETTAVDAETVKITKKDVEDMLTGLDENKDNSDNDDNCSVTKDNVTDAIELLSIADNHPLMEYLDDSATFDNFDDTKSEVSSIGENQLEIPAVEDPSIKKTLNQINSLQCLFTWNIKLKNKKNLILYIRNKYGEYNLNITSSEFTLERFIGNIIISYELFHKGESELAQMKILEIGTWLEDLDKGTDEFYLSIKTGLQHVMKATFIHMLFATNLTGECKWLLDDIESFANMDPKSRASVHAIRAAVLIEYGGNHLKKACEMAKKACDLDPKTSYWFYIQSLALTAQRQFSLSHKSNPAENEINTIHQATILSNEQNALFEYQKMVLYRDHIVENYHNNKNKNDKSLLKKNLKENKAIVHMINTIISMDPKDPHLVVKCARTLMTLPIMVRDFNLGKQYLTKAFEMAPNDATVLQAIENTVLAYKDISKKQKPKTSETQQNQPAMKNKTSNLKIDLGLIVKKQRNGEDPVPYLTNLLSKYDGLDKSKIMAQLCSYTVLFKGNLRSGVEQFIKLIEQSEIVNNDIITKHFSSFGSKSFNLSELICNEIRLATNLSGTSSDDILYYCKMLTKIIETCNLKMKDVDSSMKSKLMIDSSVKSTFSNSSVRSETESSDIESVNKNKPKKNHKAKHLKKTGPKVYTHNVKLNKDAKVTINANSKINKNDSKNPQNKKPQPKANDVNQMKVKIAKVLNSSNGEGAALSNKSKDMTTDNNLAMGQGIQRYTQQLYQNILANTQRHFIHSPNVSSSELNSYFNQNHANFSSPMQPNPFQNPYTTPLLSLRPQLSPQNPKPKPKTNVVQSHSKKK